MSNIKTTPDSWELAKSMFEAGALLKTISDRTGISVPSLSKRVKRDSWKKDAKPAPPIYLPTDDIAKKVRAMAGFGLMDEEIAAVLDMKVEVLREAFANDLVTAGPQMLAQVAQSMFKMATDANKPNVTAAIFWLKCRGGWNDDPGNAKAGKKEIRAGAAKKAAGGRFSPAAPPKLVVSNK